MVVVYRNIIAVISLLIHHCSSAQYQYGQPHQASPYQELHPHQHTSDLYAPHQRTGYPLHPLAPHQHQNPNLYAPHQQTSLNPHRPNGKWFETTVLRTEEQHPSSGLHPYISLRVDTPCGTPMNLHLWNTEQEFKILCEQQIGYHPYEGQTAADTHSQSQTRDRSATADTHSQRDKDKAIQMHNKEQYSEINRLIIAIKNEADIAGRSADMSELPHHIAILQSQIKIYETGTEENKNYPELMKVFKASEAILKKHPRTNELEPLKYNMGKLEKAIDRLNPEIGLDFTESGFITHQTNALEDLATILRVMEKGSESWKKEDIKNVLRTVESMKSKRGQHIPTSQIRYVTKMMHGLVDGSDSNWGKMNDAINKLDDRYVGQELEEMKKELENLGILSAALMAMDLDEGGSEIEAGPEGRDTASYSASRDSQRRPDSTDDVSEAETGSHGGEQSEFRKLRKIYDNLNDLYLKIVNILPEITGFKRDAIIRSGSQDSS